jgi:hypothetical protein
VRVSSCGMRAGIDKWLAWDIIPPCKQRPH